VKKQLHDILSFYFTQQLHVALSKEEREGEKEEGEGEGAGGGGEGVAMTSNLMCKVKSIGKSKWRQKPVSVLENGGTHNADLGLPHLTSHRHSLFFFLSLIFLSLFPSPSLSLCVTFTECLCCVRFQMCIWAMK
jgi:hypothetical protein